jgi:hypothetical protein
MMKKQKTLEVKGKIISVHGPYFKFSKPFGTFVTCRRDEWFVERVATDKEKQTSKIAKILGTVSLGVIVRPHRTKRRHVISQLYPTQEFQSLKKALEFLVENDGKLVFCT